MTKDAALPAVPGIFGDSPLPRKVAYQNGTPRLSRGPSARGASLAGGLGSLGVGAFIPCLCPLAATSTSGTREDAVPSEGMRDVTLRSALLLAALALASACPNDVEPLADGGLVYAGVQSVVALAGADLRPLEGTRVQLDGHGSRSLTEAGDLLLSWSQIDGPAVVLTNPSSPSPAFVAPLSPATLVFRLRAESGAGVAFDEVQVDVVREQPSAPFFVEVPRDVAVASGATSTFAADVVGNAGGAVSIEAEARCDGDVSVTVEDSAVIVRGTGKLPCLIVVDAVDDAGRRAAAAAHVLWPLGTDLPRATRLSAPVVAEPADEVMLLFDGEAGSSETFAWPAGGAADGLQALSVDPVVALSAPGFQTRLAIGADRRRGPVSGGVHYAFIDVSAGAGNRAPTADGGSDRRVRPGASFALTTGSSDLDGDPLTVEIEQVIGPAAAHDDVQPGVFHAPDDPGVLLFHVTAHDGRVRSAPASVRVVVDPSVANEGPVVDVEPMRWVSPGTVFRLDASAAYDPDSGFIERWSIAQDPSDAVVLLQAAVDEAAVDLTAGADGEVYHFRLSAFDEDGQAGFADVEVIVERAGPYVDAATGSDEQGDGTEASPFASVGAALEVAARHQLSELRIASGPQLPYAGHVVGIDLVGGYQRDGDAWIEGTAPSRLPIGSGGLVVEDSALSRLTLDLSAADASFTLERDSALSQVELSEGPVHVGPLIEVAAGATASLSEVSASATAPSAGEAVLLRVHAGAALRVSDTTLSGGAGGQRIAIDCEAATLDLIQADVVATSGASDGTGIRAQGCDIQLLDTRVSGGTATTSAIGVRAADSRLYLAPDSALAGASLGSSSSATGLLIEAGDAPVVVAGSVSAVEVGAAAVTAIGVDAASSRVAVDNAVISARGSASATALLARADGVQVAGGALDAMSVSGAAIAVDLVHADDVVLDAARLTAIGAQAFGVRAASADGVLAPRLSGLLVDVTGAEQAAGLGLGASQAVLASDVQVRVHVPGVATSTRGVGLRDGTLRACQLTVSGGGEVLGVVVATGGDGALLERTSVVVRSEGGAAVALLGGAPVSVVASFLRAESPVNALGLDARADTVLRHATVWADSTAVLGSSSSAVLDAASSLLMGDTGFERTAAAPAPVLAVKLALAAERPWVDGLGVVASSDVELDAAGCTACFSPTGPLIDDSGHLLSDEPHPLVDAGAAEFAVSVDIDGDAVPSGPYPDIGCDERAPVEPAPDAP